MEGLLPDTAPAPSIALETVLLSAARLAYFAACRLYVNKSLFADLREVIREDGLSSDVDTPDNDAIELDEAEGGYLGLSGNGGGAGAGGKALLGSRLREDGLGAALNKRPSVAAAVPDRRDSLSPGQTGASTAGRAYTRLSKALFCLAFSESCMLFTLLLFGDAVSDRARQYNWSISLLALLSIIVFVIPFVLCLLVTHRSRTTVTRTLLLTLPPFALYLFFFYNVGSLIADKLVTEGSHTFGLVNSLLSRICVPGVVLIASLSGGGALNTAWEAYEWRSVSSAEPVTEAHMAQAERALHRARVDLQQRYRSLALAQGSAAREADSASSRSFLSKWTSSNPAALHLKSVEIEVAAMEKMERQMSQDVSRLRRRKAMREMGRTFRGRLWLLVGWLFSVYCVWKIFVSVVNLIFGYTRQSHQHTAAEGAPAPQGTDLLTSLLTRLAVVLDIELDVATWSRLIGLALIGGILLANMRNVLGSVSRIFKATSAGISASFMLLFLAQLMAIYLLTSLISLPSSPTASTTSLLDTLPDFNVFSRLFDSVFLISASAIFFSRWISRKFRDDAGLAAQYSV